jgi:hypothetical protein
MNQYTAIGSMPTAHQRVGQWIDVVQAMARL